MTTPRYVGKSRAILYKPRHKARPVLVKVEVKRKTSGE